MPAQKPTEKPTSPERRSPPRPRILVCDPSPKGRQLVKAALDESFELSMAESGEEALRLAVSAAPPDLVIAAVRLPGIDGFELCRRARVEESLERMPIILVEGPGGPEDARAQALESGADDALVGPVRPRELQARVTALLRLRYRATALEARAQELEATNRFLIQARVALAHTEKRAAINGLVAGVAQEVNNPLSFITTGVSALRDYLGDVVSLVGQAIGSKSEHDRDVVMRKLSEAVIESKEVLAEIGEGAGRLHQIGQDLRLIAAEGVPEVEAVDVEEEIARAWKTALLRSGRRPELLATVDKFQKIQTSGELLRQVLMNLFVNAAQAVEPQGPSGRIWVSAKEADGEIVITVRDNGPGIPEQLINRIFDPFFTTRAGGRGAGLGLSVADSIMRSLGGSLEASSREGQGATFTVRLPADRVSRGAHEEYASEEPLG